MKNEYLANREIWEWDQVVSIEGWEVIVAVALFLMILLTIFYKKNSKRLKGAPHRFYVEGLLFKLIGCVFFCCIYIYYFGGGDTTAYFESSMALAKLFDKNPVDYFTVLFNPPTDELRSLFTHQTGYPYVYMYYDSNSYMVIKLTSVLTILTGKSYLVTSMIIAFIAYSAVWRLYLVFLNYVPALERQLALAILFFPSPVFWGSGVSKDTYTFIGVCLAVYYTHFFFIANKRKISIILMLLFSGWLILMVKPYVFMILFPCIMLWVLYHKLKTMRNAFLGRFLFPISLIVVIAVSFVVLSNLGDTMSKFSLDNALSTAQVTNNDLQKEYYGGSTSNIGTYDGTIQGLFSLFLPALNAGMFRPYLWESGSIVLMIEGLENFFLLGFTIFILFRSRFVGAYKVIVQNPILFFCIIYTLIFAFVIGITTPNFGALVRFKIPILPFYVSALFIIDYLCRKERIEVKQRKRTIGR